VTLVAVCDINQKRADEAAAQYKCKAFYDHQTLLKSKLCDAVLIATPHYGHTTIGIAALKAGLHVLVEKPISVHKADCERLIAAHKNKKQVFAAMCNQRTDLRYRKLKELIDTGALGKIDRVTWIITDWYRTEAYYASGGWRATWAGEGGGVLLNQCPHNLDLWQWMFGMPQRVRGFCKIGHKHNIEVEDVVTAYLDYDNGCSGVFITSTGEAPGTNRLEVAGEFGKVVIEGTDIRFTRNTTSSDIFMKTTPDLWSRPDVWNVQIPVSGTGGQHQEVLQNFINAIVSGEKLIAPAAEGIKSVELGNAMLFSSETQETVSLPLKAAPYERMLKQKIASSKFVKKARAVKIGSMSRSFSS
jgi:predicted dehydrogenase